MTKISNNFETYEDFLVSLENTPTPWDERSQQSIHGSKSFTHTENFQEALDLNRRGWPEGRARMAKGLAKANAINTYSPAPAQWFDVGGEYPSVPHFCAGEHEYMVNTGDVAARAKPIVRMMINASFNAGIKAANIENFGIAILSHLDRLEAEGYSVELVGHHTARSGGDQITTMVTFKTAQEPLALDRIAFAVAHPSFLRRFIFRMYEQHKSLEQSMRGGYGRPGQAGMDTREGFIYFCGPEVNQNAYSTIEKALATVEIDFEKGPHYNEED